MTIPGTTPSGPRATGAGLRELIERLDGGATPLGRWAEWPSNLRNAVGILLSAEVQIVLFWGPDFIALYNDAYAPTIGAKHPAALGRPAREHWGELWDDLGPLLQSVRDTGNTVAARDRPFYIERGEFPETVYFDISYSAVPNDRGEVDGVFCIVNETTERVRTQRRLVESEARFQAIANSVDQMIWSTRPDGFHDYYNDRWYEYTGVPYGSTDGAGWNDLFHPDDQERAWSLWRHSLATGDPYHIEYRLRHASGQYRWVLGRAQAVRDESGAISRWFGTCTDIQDLVAAREVLARSREELERAIALRTAERDRIWQVSQDLLMVADLSGVLRSVNPSWTRVLGWTPDELVGRTSEWLEYPDDIPKTRGEIARLADGQTTLSFENRFRTRDGEYRLLSWTAVPADDLLYCVARDITDGRALEEQYRQAQKMEVVGQLTGGIAHDFNNMLAVVIGALNLLERRLARGDTAVGKYVDAALEGATRAAALTQRLLAFSRQQPLAPEAINANALVAGMTDLLRRTLGENIRVETVLAAGLWRARADPTQLENSVLNLSVNARDAMPEGGRLTVETRNVRVDADYARDYGIAPGPYVRLSVADTGTGMPPEILERVFEPFFTTKGVGKGTGLGLSQVFGFARQSGGHVKIVSEVGNGTSVRLYLPRSSEVASSSEPRPPPAPPPPTGGSREIILVVEDEDRVRNYSVEALRELGYTVIHASNGPDALRLIEAGQDVTLLFTDVVMPDMTGRELAEKAKAVLPRLKVLYTSGYTPDAAGQEGAPEPGIAVLPKPFSFDQLSARIRAAIDG